MHCDFMRCLCHFSQKSKINDNIHTNWDLMERGIVTALASISSHLATFFPDTACTK